MSIKIITSPDTTEPDPSATTVFLAGGITNCPDWQADVISHLLEKDTPELNLTVFNPRQAAFDIHKPNAAHDQITWEFQHLSQMNLFSMFFYGPTKSDQPICFYELGRYIECMKQRFPFGWSSRILVTVSKDFHRRSEVLEQLVLATSGLVIPCGLALPSVPDFTYEQLVKMHAYGILQMVESHQHK